MSETMGDRVKMLMETNRITANALAGSLDVSATTINKLINNVTQDPGIKLVQKLSQFFNVTYEYLIYGNDLKGNASIVATPLEERQVMYVSVKAQFD